MSDRIVTRRWIWIALIMAVSALARLWHLASWDLWTDEMHTLRIAQTGDYGAAAYSYSRLNFVLTGWAIRVLGYSPLAARAVPAIVGIASVFLIYLVGRRWINARAGLIAASVVGLSSWHVYWSQNARHFALAALFDLLALHAFLLYWRDGRKGALVAVPVFLLLGLFTHSSTGFYLAAMGLFVVAYWLGRRLGLLSGVSDNSQRVLGAVVALGVAFLVYVPIYLQVGRLLLKETPAWNPLINVAGSFAFYMQPALVLAGAAGLVVSWKDRDELGALLAMLTVVPIALLLIASQKTTASAAYCLPTLFAVALLAGKGLDRVTTVTVRAGYRMVGPALVLGVVLTLAFDLTLYHQYYYGYKPRWREAAEFVAARRGAADLAFADEADVFRFYAPAQPVRWLPAVASTFGSAAVPPRDSGTWVAAYADEHGPMQLSERGRRFLGDSGSMKAFFPMHYGPKERSIVVYFVPVGKAASAGMGVAR